MSRHIFRKTVARGIALIAALALTTIPDGADAQTRSISIGDGVVSRIEMAAGRTLTIETDRPFADILVGNTDLIDVFPLTDTSLYIQARNFGTTNVTLYSESKKLLEVIDIKVMVDFSDLRSAIRTALPAANIEVTNVNNRIRLSGEVKDNVDLARVLEIASEYSSEPVINAIRVDSAQQVELDVRIIEVERRSGRELGVNLLGSNNSGSRQINTGLPPNSTPFGIAVGNLLEISGIQIDFVINALESKGLARRLANPKLVTTSGIAANFVVGGEVPIQVSTQSANGVVTTSTDFREFGVRLNFMPVVLDDELIRLRISPEVSDIDPTINVNGQPGFISRKAETTVSLRNGQSFAIAGLLQTNNARNVDQVPWLGQVPVIGTLFRSARFQKNESDLVILVTPRLVRPVAPGQPYASPLDNSRSSNDFELFLLGMLEVDKNLLRDFREGKGVVGPYGHIIDLEFEDGVIAKK
ncbi:type II and III secretion system protein family protein [Roseovarius autotrophicus]|uniref:type II and III secretion system protein family protein n=1 Tax=Roseovarius autotrophicus TaxID=2824121 RepID=UPI001A09954F|nr:type II and III secretion system protein family protein [Roseovarius autotrophicus]MBE0454144.1 type II and III secretion system protein family protein [Roseovarius sp.]